MGNLMAGKSVVLTGASTGLGRAGMKKLSDEGASIIAVSRTASTLQAAVDEINAAGGKVIAVPADLSDDAQVGRVIDAAITEFGRLDALINNAGVGYGYRAVRPNSMLALHEAPLDEWDHVMGINLG